MTASTEELIAGLRALDIGRRIKVAISPAEQQMLYEVAHAKLPMHRGVAWRRFSYPGLDSGPWAQAETDDLPVYLIDIGHPVLRQEAPASAGSTYADLRWVGPRKKNDDVNRVHATHDGKMTMCGYSIERSWSEKAVKRDNVCERCYARAYHIKVPPRWPVDRTQSEQAGLEVFVAFDAIVDEALWIPCVDEIELVNERHGDPRLWLDRPPDGYAYRSPTAGGEFHQLRRLHRSHGAFVRGVERLVRLRDQADARTADLAWHRRFFNNKSHVDDPRRPPPLGSAIIPE